MRIFLLLIFISSFVSFAQAQDVSGTDGNQSAAPVSFDAERLFYDDQMETVVALGDVRLEQAGRVLYADQIIYNVGQDFALAQGNVELHEKEGTIYSADHLELSDQMRIGYVQMLRGTLPDGSRFFAEEGERNQIDGDRVIMNDASYTACPACKKHPEKSPIWQLKAEKVVHHRDEQRISYKNATFDAKGVPIVWLPYFSHPDGTVDQKSGIIDPELGFDSKLGTFAGASYYYALGQDKDLTVGTTIYSDVAPLASAEYRQRFADAEIQARGTLTYSSRTDQIAGEGDNTDKEKRGHIEVDGLWDINNNWRAGFDINLTSDEQYLREYDISDEDILENELYVERFSGRNYASGRILGFQDVRVLDERTDQPNVLPELTASFLGKPNQIIGGRWAVDLSALELNRDGGGQDLGRVSTKLGWQRHDVTRFGMLTTIDLSAQGDVFYISDLERATDNSGRSRDDTETRFLPKAHVKTSYPFANNIADGRVQAVIEPIASITAAPNIGDQDPIPNEDSEDARIDQSNLFLSNRFPGYDRIEDRSHISYGLNSGLYGLGGSELSTFIGQSYAFDDEDNLFPRGSGLEEQDSDVVATVTAKYRENLEVNYRTQLDNATLRSRRHEVGARLSHERVSLRSYYFYTKPLEGTELTESREQYRGSTQIKLADQWYFGAGTVYDLGEDPGLREADFSLEYIGECISIGTFLERDLTSDTSGDSDTELFIRIGLKSLGNFKTSSIALDSSDDEE